MKINLVKRIKGYAALSRMIAELGIEPFCEAKEIDTPTGFPVTPYCYTGNKTQFYKGKDGKFFAYPEVSHKTFEVYELAI